jgi:1-deoxy-D-xylulose-5-phosphate synthase
MVLMAAADEGELMDMVATAAAHDSGPIAFRYPRGEGVGMDLPERGTVLPIGKGRILRKGTDAAILSYGTRLQEALNAAEILEQKGISVTVADARFAKPLDRDLIDDLVKNHAALITIEEGSVGGFGALVLQDITTRGVTDFSKTKFRTMTLPDTFQDHDDPAKQYAEAKLSAKHIVETICGLCQ